MYKLFAAIMFMAIAIFFQTFAEDNKAKIDETAPNFTLKDSHGKSHSLSDFAGKYIVLEWINYDCPFVKKHYDGDDMQKLQKEYAEKGVIWLAICSSAPGKQGHFDNDEINKRIKSHKAKYTAYLIDENGKVGKMYGAKTTPHMYIIDKSGILRYAGAIDSIKSTDKADVAKAKNYVKTVFDELLNGKPVSEKTTAPYGCSVKY